jgi:hypothetical protein
MSVTEAIMSPGSWSITLSPDTPRSIIDALTYFQHIVISTGRHNPTIEGNGLFNSGRYTGVITSLDFQSLTQGRGPVLSGDGVAAWLGNASKVGPVIEGNNTPGSSANGAQFTSASYATVVNTLRPASVGAGTVYSMPTSATYTGGFVWKLPSEALTSFATQITQGPLPTQIAEWRVNGNCTLDFGPVASLYRTTPVVAVVSKNAGIDMSVRGLSGVAGLVEDVKDYTTRVLVLTGGQGNTISVGVANSADVGASNPYTDFFGNPIKMTRMVSASSVSSLNANVSAQSALLPYTTPADQVRLSSSDYDIKGVLQVGDYVWLYDPDAGFVDPSNEIVFRGQRINPTKQRLIQADWPVTSNMTVAYRDQTGTWYDLTNYVVFEDGNSTQLTVGGYNRNLVSTSEPVGSRPQPDSTIPGVPVFGAFNSTSYQGVSDGRTKAQIQLTWSTPSNTDGTTLIDLDHYEIRYRPDLGFFTTNPTYSALNASGYTYTSLAALGGTYNNLIPTAIQDWKVTFVAGGVNQLLIQELTPAVAYDFQIRAVDTAVPPNYGAWSATTTFQAQQDTVPPPTPDAPTVATNMASIQVTWDCGRASGGTFNQAVDLHHVEVHGSYEPLFVPTSATKLGNMPANIGNITGQIPVVGSFTIPPNQPPANAMYIKLIAVDEAGNKSNPSAAAGSTATLWSNAYITDLSVSKLTAGTITASIILGSSIATAAAGQRCVMDLNGFHAYDASGRLVFDVNNTTPVITLGKNGASTSSITVDTSTAQPTMYYYPPAGTNPATIQAYDLGVGAGIQISGGLVSGATQRAYIQIGGFGSTFRQVNGSNQFDGGFYDHNHGTVHFGSGNASGILADFQTTFNTGNWLITGSWPSGGAITALDALCNSATDVAAGFGGLALTYGPTMATQVNPIATIYDQFSTNTYATVVADSTTGCTVDYPNAKAVRVMVWAWRQ